METVVTTVVVTVDFFSGFLAGALSISVFESLTNFHKFKTQKYYSSLLDACNDPSSNFRCV